jgi:hypothetical protein
MAALSDAEPTDGESGSEATEPVRRRLLAEQGAIEAIEAATRAAVRTSRYLPWLVTVSAIATTAIAAAVSFAIASALIHAPL